MSSSRVRFQPGQYLVPMRLALLPVLIAGTLAQQAHAAAAAAVATPASPGGAVSFDADFFPAGMAPKVDLSRFEKSGYVAPGTYRGDIVLNKAWRARGDIVYATVPGSDDTQPCFDAAALAGYGVDLAKVAADAPNTGTKPMPPGGVCAPLGDYVPGATVSFDAGSQTLSLSVPQIYTARAARGYVDPSQWDAGIDAAVANYNANVYRTDGRGGARTSAYLGLNASVHHGAWHAYHLGSLSWAEAGRKRYQNSATYVQHDIPSLQAQLVAGDTYTPGDLFDSVRLRGARLYSDDRMLPQSLRGYAPVVRGIAESNARVVVRQRGYIIYDANIAPGPFAIDDLYPTGYGGDLDVELTEADGRIKHFVVPFSAVAQLLRPGQSRWSVAVGKVAELNLENAPSVLQGTYQRGLSNRVTAYAGATLGSGYRSVLGGAALNTGVGAFSADLTQARNQAPGQRATQGASVRLGYNKNIVETGTDFAVAAYRYSTSGFVGLRDAAALRDAQARGQGGDAIPRQRSRMDLSINQMLGERGGQLYLIGSARDYWGSAGRQLDFTAGYSNHWRSITYSFSAQRTRDNVRAQTSSPLQNSIPGGVDNLAPIGGVTRRDTRFFFTLSMPLGRGAGAPSMTALLNRSGNGDGGGSQVSVSGTASADQRLSYGAALSRHGGSNSLDLHGQYNGRQANLAGSYSRGSDYRQFGAGVSGGVVAHRGGITLSPPLGDTVGLVHAPDAAGARVENGQGAVVDRRGYAVVPYLTPYQLNTVTLDPKGTDTGVEMKETTRNVAPRAGSVVKLSYETSKGRALLIESSLPDGRPIPFGADVLDEQGNQVGVAGQASRLFVNGLKQSAELTVRWGDAQDETCRIHVQLPPAINAQKAEYEKLAVSCTTTAGPALPPKSTDRAISSVGDGSTATDAAPSESHGHATATHSASRQAPPAPSRRAS